MQAGVVGTSKLLVGSSGGKMIVNTGKWSCGVCGNGGQTNTAQCTVCTKLIHKRYSGVRCDLTMAVLAMSPRPRTNALRMPSTIRNANHR